MGCGCKKNKGNTPSKKAVSENTKVMHDSIKARVEKYYEKKNNEGNK
jgi:hypothetical protein